MTTALIDYEAHSLAFEFSRKGTTLLRPQIPISEEHPRLACAIESATGFLWLSC